jgi:hypothetical protein
MARKYAASPSLSPLYSEEGVPFPSIIEACLLILAISIPDLLVLP